MKAPEQRDLFVSVRRRTVCKAFNVIAYHDPLINDKRITAPGFFILFSNKDGPSTDQI